MKAFTILATMVITITSCNCQKKTTNSNVGVNSDTVIDAVTNKTQSTVPTIYYEATSRGYSLSCKVENQMIYVSRDREFKDYSEKIQITNDDWIEISSLAKTVDLEKVKDLKWPTEKRYYDGAPHANITFESKGVKYSANGFDHGFPPAEIEKLVNKILSLVEKK